MAIVLGENQYGKAENRLFRVYRDTERHSIRDLNVSSALRGRFEPAHNPGDQGEVVPTDTQKNTVFSFAEEHGVGALEEFGHALGNYFIEAHPAVKGARVEIEEYTWDRIQVNGAGHNHSFVRSGSGVRTTVVNMDGEGDQCRTHVVSGVKDLTIAKTTGSEFHGYRKDKYTTLAETSDRILATDLVAKWRYEQNDVDWDKSFESVKALLLQTFAQTHSYALQQSLYRMGEVVLEQHPEIAEIRFSAPNKHHFLYDLERFDVDNPGEVFHAADRPYGLIEATVQRDNASEAGSAWHGVPGFC